MGLACCCGFPPNSQALLKGWTRPIGWCLWRANPQKTSNSKKKHTVSDGISVFFLESSFVHVHTPNAPAAAATSTVVEAKQLPQTCSKAWTCSSCFNEQGELQEKELCQHIKKTHTHTHQVDDGLIFSSPSLETSSDHMRIRDWTASTQSSCIGLSFCII